jgi:hypothetical protein
VCKFARRKSYECHKTMRVIRPHHTFEIRVEESDLPHSLHLPKIPLEGALKLTPEVKQILNQSYNDNKTASQVYNNTNKKNILHYLQARNTILDQNRNYVENTPTLNQIENFYSRLRKKDGGTIEPTIKNLSIEIFQRFQENDDVYEPFLFGHKIEGQKFIFVWSSKNLIQKFKRQGQNQLLQIDATYKIVHAGLPIFVNFIILFYNFIFYSKILF